VDPFNNPDPEKYLYRYRSASLNSLDELTRHYCYAASKEQLNDINEFHFTIDDGGLRECSVEEKIEWLMSPGSLMSDVVREKERENIISTIAKKGPKAGQQLVDKLLTSILQVRSESMAEIYKAIQTVRVVCFSEKPLNPTMFGHYGSNKGIVVAYDRKLIEEHYADSLFKVKYGELPYSFPVTDFSKANDKNWLRETRKALLANKYSDWEYEAEIRILVNPEEKQLAIPPGAIKAICLAPKAEDSLQATLWDYCKNRGVDLFLARPKEFSYGLRACKSKNVEEIANSPLTPEQN